MSNKLKLGDTVIVCSGRSKGSTGEIISFVKPASHKSGKRALVRGVQMMKKHVKPDPQNNIAGGIENREAPIDMSNLAILNPKTSKADRIRIEITTGEDGKKTKKRLFVSTGESVDNE